MGVIACEADGPAVPVGPVIGIPDLAESVGGAGATGGRGRAVLGSRDGCICPGEGKNAGCGANTGDKAGGRASCWRGMAEDMGEVVARAAVAMARCLMKAA